MGRRTSPGPQPYALLSASPRVSWAALQATRDTLPSWSKFMSMYKKVEEVRAYGAWLERGFSSGRPGSCITWGAPMKSIG